VSNDVQQVRRFMEEAIPFNKYLGFKVDELGDGYAKLSCPFRPEFTGDPHRPAIHGGLLAALADVTGGTALWSSITAQDRVATVDMRIDYLRPCPLEDLVCEAKVVRIGNRVGVVDMTITAAGTSDKPIATGKGVYNIRRSS
jgi:uncharacterized protein (TIGR00369 family)